MKGPPFFERHTLNPAIRPWANVGGVQVTIAEFCGPRVTVRSAGLRTTELAARKSISPTPPPTRLLPPPTRLLPPPTRLLPPPTRLLPPPTRLLPPPVRLLPPLQKSLPVAPTCRKSMFDQSSKPCKADSVVPSKLISWSLAQLSVLLGPSRRYMVRFGSDAESGVPSQ